MTATDLSGYSYRDAAHSPAHGVLLPALIQILDTLPRKQLFEVGSGNGAIASALSALGWDVTGVEPSTLGVEQANSAYPHIAIRQGDAYQPLAERYGRFPIVLSLEVIEHVMWPRKFMATCRDLLEPAGTLILSTPYHGYLKNLAISVVNGWDHHFTALWDGGHIKFWSIRTLSALLEEAGFRDLHFRRVGRIPPLAQSMIVTAKR